MIFGSSCHWGQYSWLTVGQGLLSLQQVRVDEECYFFCFFPFYHFPLSSLSLFHLFYLFSAFLWETTQMTHKGWHIVKPQHNQWSDLGAIVIRYILSYWSSFCGRGCQIARTFTVHMKKYCFSAAELCFRVSMYSIWLKYLDALTPHHFWPKAWTSPFNKLLTCTKLLVELQTVYTLIRCSFIAWFWSTLFVQVCLSEYSALIRYICFTENQLLFLLYFFVFDSSYNLLMLRMKASESSSVQIVCNGILFINMFHRYMFFFVY